VTPVIRITRAGPATTIQDAGRFGALQHGISASGPMDRGAFARAGAALDRSGAEAIEFTRAGLAFVVEGGSVRAAFDGGKFALTHNGVGQPWPNCLTLAVGDRVEITPGPAGNYGYARFDHALDLPAVLGSRATNLVAGLGGFEGRALHAGDRLAFGALGDLPTVSPSYQPPDGPFRFIWGIHADLFTPGTRQAFIERSFVVSNRLDRMGVGLSDPGAVFAGAAILSLVSDAIVAGDVQILGDGTPIVLMRDHQPTGGYPRIATVVSADLDRLAQLRPGTELAFSPVTLQKARQLYLTAGNP
jgi:biotin-dependent carboxylase-like uncharacterized protein